MPDPYVIIEVDWPLDKRGRTAATGKGPVQSDKSIINAPPQKATAK